MTESVPPMSGTAQAERAETYARLRDDALVMPPPTNAELAGMHRAAYERVAGQPVCVCGHPFGWHGDRAVASCMPDLFTGRHAFNGTVRYDIPIYQRCDCDGWRPA